MQINLNENGNELEALDYLNGMHAVLERFGDLWLEWCLGHMTDRDLQGERDQLLIQWSNFQAQLDNARDRHMTARQDTRKRYKAELGTQDGTTCDLCGTDRQLAGPLQNIGTAPDHCVYACRACVEDRKRWLGPLTPFGEALERLQGLAGEVAAATRDLPEDVINTLYEALQEAYRAKQEQDRQAALWAGAQAADRDLQREWGYRGVPNWKLARCHCKMCMAELQRRAGRGEADNWKAQLATQPNPTSPNIADLRTVLGLFGLDMQGDQAEGTEPKK